MTVTRTIASAALLIAGIVIGLGYGRWYGPRETSRLTLPAKQPTGYHCPMHPNFRSEKPGDCGICRMKLVPDDVAPGAAPAKAGSSDEAAEHVDAASALPPGAIHISPQKQQLIGVKYGEAAIEAGVRTFRALGKVALDETRLVKVQTRIDGWVDKVFADFTGKLVQKGQPLLTLYSPEMLASQQEYLLALRSRELMRASPLAGSREHSESLIAAARRRLELWELSDEQIGEITSSAKPIKNITIYAPISGYVITRNAFPKQRVTPETELYTVADLSAVWIMADVFENDIPLVREGMPVRVSLASAGGRSLAGRVNYLQPQVDPATRTLKVRIEAANPQMLLKPEMFADVEFRVALPARLTVPAEAVLDSGLRQTVFVDLGNGHLEPRQVETGERSGGRVEITRGLRAGERVVTSGNFLIDSESQLKSATAGMAGHAHGDMTAAPAASKPAPAAGEHHHD